ncbi:MAG: hypothetical protein AAF870_04065, partial [Pseudomonadota bacterium]
VRQSVHLPTYPSIIHHPSVHSHTYPPTHPALMSVYFDAIEGQQPNPEWDAKLANASDKFRELAGKASDAVGGTAFQRS